MRTDKRGARHVSLNWEIVLGVLFVVSFLGVTLALIFSDSIAAAPDAAHVAVSADPLPRL